MASKNEVIKADGWYKPFRIQPSAKIGLGIWFSYIVIIFIIQIESGILSGSLLD